MPSVTCPSCFESFEVAAPALAELPSDVDYDCEVCCRPMRIYFDHGDGSELDDLLDLDEEEAESADSIVATAYGLGDAGPCG